MTLVFWENDVKTAIMVGKWPCSKIVTSVKNSLDVMPLWGLKFFDWVFDDICAPCEGIKGA